MSQQATGFFREQNMLVRKHLEKQIKELKKKYADVIEKNKKLYKRNRLIADYCKTLEKERDTIITGYDDILDTYKKENKFYKNKMNNNMLKNGKVKLTLRERINRRKRERKEEKIVVKKVIADERLPKMF
tara:strand:- start:673 stop:1062 length:390 start_codon:yes stop_codon:yes gene_type:complete